MKFFKSILILSLIISGLSLTTSTSLAQTQTLTSPTQIPADSESPTQSSFRIVICDGPELPPDTAGNKSARAALIKDAGSPGQYIPCNFNGAMIQVQHLINICMVLGVLSAIVLFTYAGYLLMTGKEDDRKKAKDIFPKIGIGFLVMLSAWFIVFQILNWLTGDSVFTKLLGS